MTSLTISIPAYNDRLSLEDLLNDILALNLSKKFKLSLLIINDGSSDDTAEFLARFTCPNILIQIISHEKNRGFGESFKKAFMTPKSDWVFFISGDNQFPANNLLLMEKAMSQFSLIIGRRDKRQDNLYRRVNSLIYNKVISWIAGQKINDVNSILLFQPSVLDNINLESNSAFINAEFILKTIRQNILVTEVPVIHQSRKNGVGSGGKWSVIRDVIRDVFSYLLSRS